MKILVIGDLHRTEKRLKAITLAWNSILEQLVDQTFDKIVFLGDMFTKNPTMKDRTDVAVFLNILKSKLKKKTKGSIILIQGTGEHDFDTQGDYYLADICEVDPTFKPMKQYELDNFLFVHEDIVGLKYSNGYTTEKGVKLELKSNQIAVAGHYHCFSKDTELLTLAGWKSFDEIKLCEKIATLNLNNNTIEYNPIKHKFKHWYTGNLFHIKTKHIDLLVTPNHKIVTNYVYKTQQMQLVSCADTFLSSRQHVMPISGQKQFEKTSLDLSLLELRLLIQIITDGSTEKSLIRFHLKKDRKIKRLVALLCLLGVTYKKYNMKDKSTKIDIKKKSISRVLEYLDNNRTLNPILRTMDTEQFQIFLNEFANTDGNYSNTSSKRLQLYTTNRANADLIQELCVINNCSCNMYERIYTNKKHKTCYLMNICIGKTFSHYKPKNNFQLIPYNNFVYCVSVVNSTLIVRRNGKVTISGNSPSEEDNIVPLGSVHKVTIAEKSDNKRFAIIEKNKIKFLPITSRPMYELPVKGYQGKVSINQKIWKLLTKGLECDLKLVINTDSVTLPKIHEFIKKVKDRLNIEYYQEDISVKEDKVDIPKNLNQLQILKKYCKDKGYDYQLAEKEYLK